MSTDKKKGGFRDVPPLNVLSENKAINNFLHSGSSESSSVEAAIAPNVDEDHPWMSVSGDDRTQHITRVPLQLKKLIEYLGDTTRGENMTSISVAGLTAQAEKMAKEKGLPLPPSWGSWLKK
jgi:hypothetical protein